jgi:tetratricopeptide (TPR) repeat protein
MSACFRTLRPLRLSVWGTIHRPGPAIRDALVAAKAGRRPSEEALTDSPASARSLGTWRTMPRVGSATRKPLVIARELGDRQSRRESGSATSPWWHHGLAEYTEARSKYERAQWRSSARSVTATTEAVVPGPLGLLASDMGEYQEALCATRKPWRSSARSAIAPNEAGYIGNIGRVSLRLGDYPQSRSRFEEALAIARELGDRQSEGYWMGSLGEVACQVGDYHEARDHCEEALAIASEVGDRRSQRDWLGELGGIECNLGNHTEASAHYLEALTIAREVGRPDNLLLENCAELLVALGRYEHAAELLGAADAVATQIHRQASVSEQSRCNAVLEACRARQREEAFELAFQSGQASDWANASARASEFLEQI